MTAGVLNVDELLPNVKLLEGRLPTEYFDVASVTNGPEALELCLDGRCDIVLLDVMMPGIDGFEFCARLKADPATTHLPVVMVTVLDQQANRLRSLECGADDFLTKPVDEMALIARVRSLTRFKMMLDELLARARPLSVSALARPAPNPASAAAFCSGRTASAQRNASSTRCAPR